MLTKDIIFKNFSGIKNKKKIKTLSKFIRNKNLLNAYPVLKSLTKDYEYSYKKADIKNLQKSNSFNLIGMGGAILGTEAIYDFLKHKVKKNFSFFNNLQCKKNSKSKFKKINLIISKSGNTLETISNFNLILKTQKKK